MRTFWILKMDSGRVYIDRHDGVETRDLGKGAHFWTEADAQAECPPGWMVESGEWYPSYLEAWKAVDQTRRIIRDRRAMLATGVI